MLNLTGDTRALNHTMMQQLRNPLIFQSAVSTYTATHIIGEGGPGRVYKATDESEAQHAIKMLKPESANAQQRQRFNNELCFGLDNAHQNIITITDYGLHHSEAKRIPFYVMPLYRCSLRTLMNDRIHPHKVLRYFSQLLNGIEAAHIKGIVHRDLRPENILYDEEQDRLILADFGRAHFTEADLYMPVDPSPQIRLVNKKYAAAEPRVGRRQVKQTADIFALGCILNGMFTGEIPNGTDYKTIGGVTSQYGYLDEIVAQMMHPSPDARPASVEVIKKVLMKGGSFTISINSLTSAIPL